MVRTAQREQVVGLMIAAVFARAEMMHVDERRVPAAGYLAAVPIAQQHRATNSRRNRLRSALMWPGGRNRLRSALMSPAGGIGCEAR